MWRYVIFIFMALSACSGGSKGPPSRPDDACAIRAERPEWFTAMRATEARWGAPVHVQLATFYQESSFRPDARTPRKYFLGFIPAGRVSSAYGYSQAIDGTWDWYRTETGSRRASRDDFADASDFMGWYMAQTAKKNDVAMADAYNQYLAYHEGHAGYARGSYRSKSWLTATARKVAERAETYRWQLAICEKWA